MIVKIQVSLQASDNQQRMFIYNRDRSISIEDVVSPEVIEVMAGRPKAFFEVDISLEGELVTIDIKQEAEWQDW